MEKDKFVYVQKEAAPPTAAAAAAAAAEKQKEEKMTKARSNMYVYTSTRICGLIFENEKTVQPESTRATRKTHLTHPYIIPNFHAERKLEHPKTTFFSSFLQLQQYTHVRTSSSCCLSLIKGASYTRSVLRYRYGTLL